MVDTIRLKGKQQKVRLYGVDEYSHGDGMKYEILLKRVYEPARPSDGCRIRHTRPVLPNSGAVVCVMQGFGILMRIHHTQSDCYG